MTLLERLQKKQEERREKRRLIDEKNVRGFDKDLEFEKGDLFAIAIAGLINFVLPIMVIIAAVCGVSYLLFSGIF